MRMKPAACHVTREAPKKDENVMNDNLLTCLLFCWSAIKWWKQKSPLPVAGNGKKRGGEAGGRGETEEE